MNTQIQHQEILDDDDLKIEKGDLDPPGDNDTLYSKGVLNVLQMVHEEKTYPRPRGKRSPIFSFEEIEVIGNFLFFKPRNIVLKVYKRLPRDKELPLRKRMFLKHLFGDAGCNAAKAARMAGYSPKSAKQVAYKIMHS